MLSFVTKCPSDIQLSMCDRIATFFSTGNDKILQQQKTHQEHMRDRKHFSSMNNFDGEQKCICRISQMYSRMRQKKIK